MAEIKALEMVRRIRDAQCQATKDMSREELKAYFRDEAERVPGELRNARGGRRTKEGVA